MYVFDAAKLFTTQYPLYASTHPPGRGLSSAGPIPHQSFIRSGNCAPDTPGTRPTAGSRARAKSTRYGNYRLRAAECLGVRSPALHATQARHPQKYFTVPPVTIALGGEALVQQFDLAPGDVGRQREVDRGAAEVTVPLRDLVREEELITEDGG